MSDIDRRAFLKSSAGVAGASLFSTHIASGAPWSARECSTGPRTGIEATATGGRAAGSNNLALNVTMRGLCVFVRRKDGSVDVVMLNHEQRSHPPVGHPVIHEHAARLIAEDHRIIQGSDGVSIGEQLTAWKLRGYRITILPSGTAAETVIADTAIEHPWQSFQWLMNLKRSFPEGKLRTNLAEGGDNVVAGLLNLSGGRLEGMVPSSGLGNIATWSITSQEASPKTFTQAMTDQVFYRLPLPSGTTTVTIKRTPLNDKAAAPVKDIVLSVSPKSEPLTLALDHTLVLDPRHGDAHETSGEASSDNTALPHTVVFYDVFSNAPALGPIPKRTLGLTERLPREDRTGERVQANDTDPYCQCCYYDELCG